MYYMYTGSKYFVLLEGLQTVMIPNRSKTWSPCEEIVLINSLLWVESKPNRK